MTTSTHESKTPAEARDRVAAATSGRGPGRRSSTRSPVGLILAVATVLVLIGGAIVVWASPILGVREVEVVGAESAATVAEVQNAAAVPDGYPLARVNLTAVRDRVQAVAAVAGASVSRNWPNGIVVTISERVAVATTQANGHWWLVDKSGLPFRELDSRPTTLMPLELATPGVGDRATVSAIAVLRSLRPDLRSKVSAIAATTEYGVTLLLPDGRSVIWGTDAASAEKNAVAIAILSRPGQVFDISDPTLVTVSDH